VWSSIWQPSRRILDDRNDAAQQASGSLPQSRVERAEAALQSYRTSTDYGSEPVDMVDQQLVDLNRQLAVARSDLAEPPRNRPLSIGKTTSEPPSREAAL
jgi:hypothetical protein